MYVVIIIIHLMQILTDSAFKDSDELSFFCREYSKMVSVRYVDFSESDRPKSLKIARQTVQSVRSSPHLVGEAVLSSPPPL